MLNVFNAPTSAASARVAWSIDLGRTLYGKPTVKEDEVVLGSFDDVRCQVHRLSLADGSSAGTVNVSHQGTLEGEMANHLVLKGQDGNLFGADAETGQRLWGYQPNGYPAVVATSDKMTVVGGRNSLTGLKPGDDEVSLDYNLPVRNTTGLTLREDGSVLAQTQQGKLYNINPRGALTWSADVEAGGPQHRPVVGPDGTVYSVGFGGTLTALSEEGDRRWQYRAGENYVNAPTPGSNNEVVTSTFKGSVTSLAAHNGEVKWTHKAGSTVDGTFVHEDGTVFYHTRGGLTALEPTRGNVVQQLELPEGELAQALDGSLILSTRDGNVQRIVLE